MATSGLYSVDATQEQAKQLTREGGTLLLLGIPQGTIIGIDQQTQLTGEKFKGIKMIPPGIHLVAYNSVSSQGDFSPTTSFFVHFQPQQVIVRQWNAETELLHLLEDEDVVVRYAEGVRRFDFDSGLAPYNLRAFSTWKQLSGFIDAATIDRLAPAGGIISIIAEIPPGDPSRPSKPEVQLEQQLASSKLHDRPSQEDTDAKRSTPEGQPSAETSTTGRCHYTEVPRTVKNKEMSASALTAANLDKSALLEQLITEKYHSSPNSLLGELQFAFLAFLVGQSLEGFSQWKSLLHLLLSCESAPLQKRPKFFARLLTVLEAQLDFCLGPQASDTGELAAPMGVPMVDELLADSFLKRLLAQFFDLLATASKAPEPSLKAASESLQETLKSRLGWDFRFTELAGEGSDDEYAPVVVDL